MTSPSPLRTTKEPEESGSIHWTSIKLNVIMIPASVGFLIILIAVVCICKFIRKRRNEEFEQRRQREFRMAKKQYSQKLNEGLKNSSVINSSCERKKPANGKPFSPRCKKGWKTSSTVSNQKYDNGCVGMNPLSKRESGASQGTLDKTVKNAPLLRQETYTIEDQRCSNVDSGETSYSIDENVNVQQGHVNAAYTINSDRTTLRNVRNEFTGIGGSRERGDSIKSDTTPKHSPVRINMNNGTIDSKQTQTLSVTSPPNVGDRKSWNKPPPTYCTTRLLQHDRKIIPPINHLPVVK